MRFRFQSSLIALCLLLSGAWADDRFYDEVFESKGKVRPQYQEAYRIYRSLDKERKKRFLPQSKKDFGGDNMLHPMMRILKESEARQLW